MEYLVETGLVGEVGGEGEGQHLYLLAVLVQQGHVDLQEQHLVLVVQALLRLFLLHRHARL